MLEKRETQRNTIGICENSNPKLVHDYNSDYSRIVLSNYNSLKAMQGGRSPRHHHHHQLLHYLQERHEQQQWPGALRRHPHPALPPHHLSSHSLHSQVCFEQERSDPRFFEIKAEFRSTERGEECVEKNWRIQSPSSQERGGDGERQRRLLGLHPNMTGLKGGMTTTTTPLTEGRGVVEQERRRCYRRQTCHSRERRAHDKSDKNMNQEKEVHIKVDDDDDDDIDVTFDEDDNKQMLKCKFTICHDDDNSNNSSINDRSCSLSSSSSTNSSVCSGDDEDVDSGIDGGHHNNNVEIERRKGFRMIDISPTEESAISFQANLAFDNRRIKEDVDTDYKYESVSETGKMGESAPPGECGLYYQHRRTPPPSRSPSPRQQQQIVQDDKLSAIFTNDDTNNPPDLARKFTNFFIDDILKPEFGKRPFETGTTTICTVGHKLKSPPSPFSAVSSSSFPFSISSLSQSALLSSSFAPITSHNSSVPSGKKKAFSRYVSSNHPRKSPSTEDSSRSLLVQSVNNKSRGTAKKKDLTTAVPVDPKTNETNSTEFQFKYPAWVFCTRYSDRPSSGPRSRKMKRKDKKADEKRPRTAFTPEQLQRLKREFDHGRYLTEERRQALAKELGLNESQIKIWFQNKRAKMKKVSGAKNPLALQLIAEGLYNHQTSKDSP